MDAEKNLSMLMPYITAKLIKDMMAYYSISEKEAFELLYHSQLYADLEREATKNWQYSDHLLFELFKEEQNTGMIHYPEY